ncbi:TonB-dependent receptor [uncultured Mucilaginibacter sp.]|uniref:SusC/RagA family TonB-linked outer membrane protein n=1 Tax=uncultured Mucilaginibacter sp. TaxID=797541 RepID=UPI002621D903|nr:TonB-dependent receptor [uncultured Mucilaginibacter sp.]
MKKILPEKFLLVKKPPFYLGCIILLFISSFGFAKGSNGVLAKNVYVTGENAKKIAVPIKGKVTELLTNQALPGVSVRVKGTSIGVVTDINGNFTIDAPAKSTLVFTYIGFETVETPVDGRGNYNIQLKASSSNLNEVVVVGYGTQKKTSVTASVSTINTAEIAQKPVVNLTNSLVGRASGLIATQGSGEPGNDGSGLLIRGPATPGRTAPLTVVDGVPRDFSRLDPNTIETLTVLKDAAAVAPYGVAGANGVILITTKAGKSGKPTLTYNAYYGIQNPTSVPKFVNSYQYAMLRNEAIVNDFTYKGIGSIVNGSLAGLYTATDLALFQNHQDPDGHADGHPLDDIIKKNRPIQYHNLSLSGGTDDIKYFASLGFNRQDGMWDPTYLNKFNGSLSVTANATKTTTVNLRVNSYEEDQHYPGYSAGNIIGLAQRQNPTYPLRYTNGLESGYIGASLYGEVYNSGYVVNKNTDLFTQLSIDQKLPIKGLSIKGVVTYESGPDPLGFSGNQTSFSRAYILPVPFTNPRLPAGVLTPGPGVNYVYTIGYQGFQKPTFQENFGVNKMFTYQGLLNYARTFGKSDITAVAVAEYRIVNYQNFFARSINYNLSIDELNYGGPLPTDATVGGSSGGQKQLGYVYRVGYAYDGKYLFEAAGRYDGSYVFAPGHRFGFFPAFSAGWRLSEEKFIKDNFTWVDNLKLRASYGQSGNYPNGGQYQYLSQFGAYSNSAVIGPSATQGISENLQGNPNITWERSKKTDVGFEGSFWKGAFGIEADYFYEKRSNFLVGIGAVLPAEYGVNVGQVNGGILSNHGVELTLTTFKNFSKDLRLDVKGTFTFAKNKILQIFENTSTFNNPNRRQTGRALGEQFGLKALGYYTPNDFINPTSKNPTLKPGIPTPIIPQVYPGDIKYADLSGPNNVPDGKIDANDITDIGPPQTPQIIYGIEPRLTYKNFDLDLLFQGSGLSSIGLSSYYVFPFVDSGSATELVYQNHWTPNNPNARYPVISGTPSPNNTQYSSWFLRNDSYIRLKSAELGYTFSNKLLGHTIRSLRVYAAGQNIFFWTPAMKETIDPENSGSNQNYYQQRVLSLGLNVTF